MNYQWLFLALAGAYLSVCVRVCVSTSMVYMEEYSFPTFHFHAAMIYEVPPKVSN